MLRHSYQTSPFKIERILTSLTDQEFSIGLSFAQQIRAGASVPDAMIRQQSLRIFIETKRGGKLDAEQLRRHIQSIGLEPISARTDILIGLSKERILDSEVDLYKKQAKEKGVIFAATTFTSLVSALRVECASHETELCSMIDDYEEYLADEGLLEERNKFIAVFPCGVSIAENERYRLYYEPADRACKRYNFIGIYSKKRIAFVGSVEAIAIASSVDGETSLEKEYGEITSDHESRVLETIKTTEYYDLRKEPVRFYLVDRFSPTEFVKVSPGGMLGHRNLDLCSIIPGFDPGRTYSTDELAELVRNRSFE